MKFQKINEGSVQRDDGVSFQIMHPDYLEYRDSDHVAIVSMDYDPRTRQITVYASSVDKWNTANEIVPMSDTEKMQLVKDLTEGLFLLNRKFVVV